MTLSITGYEGSNKSKVLLPADVKVRKWLKATVNHGRIRLKKWVPEHERQSNLKDLRPTKDLSDLRRLKKRKRKRRSSTGAGTQELV